MKIIDRLISFIFNVFVIVLAVAILLVTTNIISQDVINNLLNEYVFNTNYRMIVISVAIVVILLGLKTTVFTSVLSTKAKKNILVDTPHGKIQIAQDTIENIAKNVIGNYSQIRDVQARMTKASRGINMYMVLNVNPNTNIKDIVTKVQDDVKKQIESTTGVSVKNVDVKIKNVVKPKAALDKDNNKSKEIVSKPEKTVKEEKNETKMEENKETKNDEMVREDVVREPASEEYKKDENDVLYRVEPNPNSPENK